MVYVQWLGRLSPCGVSERFGLCGNTRKFLDVDKTGAPLITVTNANICCVETNVL